MTLHVCLYTKKNCPKCKITKRLLQANHIPVVDNYHGDPSKPNMIDLDSNNPIRLKWSQHTIDKLKARGVKAMPYVQVVDDSKSTPDHKTVIETWSDFHPDKIKQLAQLVAQAGGKNDA